MDCLEELLNSIAMKLLQVKVDWYAHTSTNFGKLVDSLLENHMPPRIRSEYVLC